MCIRCREIERDLEYFCELQASTTDDPVASVLLAESINDLQLEKASLHPVDHPAVNKPGDL